MKFVAVVVSFIEKHIFVYNIYFVESYQYVWEIM